MTLLENYIKEVKEQLVCNATNEYKDSCITFNYTNQEVDDNIEYFKQCLEDNLSSYKALCFFNEYLDEQKAKELAVRLIDKGKDVDDINNFIQTLNNPIF